MTNERNTRQSYRWGWRCLYHYHIHLESLCAILGTSRYPLGSTGLSVHHPYGRPVLTHHSFSPGLSLFLCIGYVFGPTWKMQSVGVEASKPFELSSVRRWFSQDPSKIDVSNYYNSNFSTVISFDKLWLNLLVLIGTSWLLPKEQHEAGIFSLSKEIACIFPKANCRPKAFVDK